MILAEFILMPKLSIYYYYYINNCAFQALWLVQSLCLKVCKLYETSDGDYPYPNKGRSLHQRITSLYTDKNIPGNESKCIRQCYNPVFYRKFM